MGLQQITKGQLPLASDVNQLIRLFQGLVDIGALVLPTTIASPSSAPTVTLSSGSITGTAYQWGIYWITGTVNDSGTVSVTGRTTPSPYSTAQALTSQQATVSIAALTIPSAVIGWGVVRNKSGGSTWYEVPGSEQFGNSDGSSIPMAYVDDTTDANLVTPAPSSNTTGSYLENYLRTDSGAPNPQTVANGVTFNSLTTNSASVSQSTSPVWSAHAPDGHEIRIFPSMSGGAYNSLVQAGDTGIIYDLGTNSSSGPGLVIGPWTVSGGAGLRLDGSGNMTVAGSIASSAGQLGSASGTWTPAAGSLGGLAAGTVINVAAVPSAASVYFIWLSNNNYDNMITGAMTSSGAYFTWSNSINGGNVYGNGATGVSSTSYKYSNVGGPIGLFDGTNHVNGYFQINGGYLQFVVTIASDTLAGSVSSVRWGVS